ncbi:conserved hypothetical protein [Pedosphaera parvula Ellin514]|uniref:Beta-galactosidase trimerisation domain-containing protein n=2 Tax=Pedosphaera TaxID=1032526 RepID=B9XK83_PEDPL|nr:conserved hypothetical protein [Pedosphaera parvula Ellin514]
MHPMLMNFVVYGLLASALIPVSLFGKDVPTSFPVDPSQGMERTCFQTSKPFSSNGDLRSDVAIVYGIDEGLPDRIATWRERGYRIHVMSGASWGKYYDYVDGRFDGTNHLDEAQTERNGNKIGHGEGMYYMSPGENYGKYLCVGVQRALDAGAEAIHLEEPEFWVRAGYSEGFKREWQTYYGEAWQPPHTSVDAQWRASKLKYYLYRRALQQVFDYVQAYNQRTGRKVRCYVPTHSLLNYSHWHIVSPESSLAQLNGCDGYIAQVWTGTSRTPNVYRGQLRERTFETAFLEYGAMQNLVRSTGRTVWYLNDPIEDNPNHDWEDYRTNWESTLVASLLQPDVWRYEVAPWPERIFGRKYPKKDGHGEREAIPPTYATELQTVMSSLNDINQSKVKWDCGSQGIGFVVSDSLMFERGEPVISDEHMSHIYGMALPFVKRGMPITPVQLENVNIAHYLDGFKVLLLTYQGMKPLTPEVHAGLAKWVKQGGVLVVCDDDKDPYNQIREWWNQNGLKYSTPREHLFEQLGWKDQGAARDEAQSVKCGRGKVIWLRESPVRFAESKDRENQLVGIVQDASKGAGVKWQESNYLLLRRGPYLIAAGMGESDDNKEKVLQGKLVNLFDPELKVQDSITVKPGSRYFLLDLDAVSGGKTRVLASACKALPYKQDGKSLSLTVEGVANTLAIVLLHAGKSPQTVTLDGKAVNDFKFDTKQKLLWVRFENESVPRKLEIQF